MKRYVLSLMAANRVGILAALTSALGELGSDLQEVNQTVVNGIFTVVLAADFPDHREPEVIVEHIRGVCKPFGITIGLKDATNGIFDEIPTGNCEKYFLTLTGHDTPGLIRQVCSRLAGEKIDIIALYAVREDRGGPFVMILELAVPNNVDTRLLRDDLQAVEDPQDLSVRLEHERAFDIANGPRPVRISHVMKQVEIVQEQRD